MKSIRIDSKSVMVDVPWWFGLVKGFVVSYLKTNKEHLVDILSYYVNSGIDQGLSKIIEEINQIPNHSLFQKAIRWLFLDFVKKNLGIISSYLSQYTPQGARVVVEKLIELIERL